ncbi:MAG: MotE family protein [Alphaproteobacteria bacterium]
MAACALAALVMVKAFDVGQRIPLGIGEVAAADAAETPSASPGADDAAQAAMVATAEGDAADAGAVQLDDLTPGDLALLQQLAERRAELDRREQDLATREQALDGVERRVEDKVAELKALLAKLDATIVERDAAQEEQLRSLVKIYENMKPKDAAVILNQLDTTILLDVIDRMKEAKAAPILALMDPERARTVTQDLAHRRELPSANN